MTDIQEQSQDNHRDGQFYKMNYAKPTLSITLVNSKYLWQMSHPELQCLWWSSNSYCASSLAQKLGSPVHGPSIAIGLTDVKIKLTTRDEAEGLNEGMGGKNVSHTLRAVMWCHLPPLTADLCGPLDVALIH